MRNAPHRHLCLNTWSLGLALFGEVMEPLGGTTLLEEELHWGGFKGLALGLSFRA